MGACRVACSDRVAYGQVPGLGLPTTSLHKVGSPPAAWHHRKSECVTRRLARGVMERLGLLLGPTISISQGANRPNQRAFRSDGGLISRPGMQLSELAYLVANPRDGRGGF